MATIMIELEPARARRSHTGPLPRPARPAPEVYLRRRAVVALVVFAIVTFAGLSTRSLSEAGGNPASVPGSPAAALGTPVGSAPRFYVVQPGDSLWSIGASLGLERIADFVDEVEELNGVTSVDVGMRIRLPD